MRVNMGIVLDGRACPRAHGEGDGGVRVGRAEGGQCRGCQEQIAETARLDNDNRAHDSRVNGASTSAAPEEATDRTGEGCAYRHP